MKEIIIALLGGGAAVQVANTLATLRQNRRQLNAEALGTEVAALERTISVLRENFERENERQREEITVLRQEIRFLHNENGRLQVEINRLRQSRAGAEPFQLQIPSL